MIGELTLPQSGILAYQDTMPDPNIGWAMERGFDSGTLQSYFTHLYLRKSVNRIYAQLYDPELHKPEMPFSWVPDNEIVEGIRYLQPPGLASHHDDLPAKDILSARLHAKHWAAQVLLYRPFIRRIVEFNFTKPPSFETLIPTSVMEYATRGIHALIKSSRAFHGLQEGFIVTDIFGMAQT
jgi:hypothetical protein